MAKDVREDLKKILSGLSDDYEAQTEGLNFDNLFQEAVNYFKRELMLTEALEVEEAAEAGLIKEAEEIWRKALLELEKLETATGSQSDLIDLSEDKEIEPVKWIVPGLIPAGLTIVGGQPKIGKTELFMNIAVDLALGRKVLDSMEVSERKKMLFCALETPERKLRSIINNLLMDNQKLPEGSLMALAIGGLPAMDQGCIPCLEKLVEEHGFEMIVIDTLECIRPEREQRNQNAYRLDVKLLRPIQSFSHKHDIALVLLTHTTKNEYKDLLKNITGSHGQAGTADEAMIMTRDVHTAPNGRLIEYQGRELGHGSLRLAFEAGRYSLLEAGGEAKGNDDEVSEQRRIILDFLRRQSQPVTRKQLLEGIEDGVAKSSLDGILRKMFDAGKLAKPGYGLWAVPVVAVRYKARKRAMEAGGKVLAARWVTG